MNRGGSDRNGRAPVSPGGGHLRERLRGTTMSLENRSIPVAVGRGTGENGPHQGVHQTEELQEARGGYHTPLIDIHEGPDGLVLEADLPGADENQVNIQLEDNVLSLHARLTPPVSE